MLLAMASDTESRFTWTIENFSTLTANRHYSDVFVIDGFRWRLLIFPKGNNVDQLSIYLDAVDSSILPHGWSRYVEFSLAVVNQIVRLYTVQKETNHKFNARENDWGFASFMPLSDLHDLTRGFLQSDTLIIEAEFVKHDHSKVGTCFLGLEKQVVHFRSLEKPEEDVFSLELWNLLRCDEVVQRVARHLGIHDPSKIRLTHHDWDSGEPAATPLKYRDMDLLQDMPADSSKTFNIFYYEVLDDSLSWPGDKTNDQKMSSSCSICWSAPKEGVCVPCGHVAACMSCLNKIQNKMYGCPVCRTKIEQVIRIFIS